MPELRDGAEGGWGGGGMGMEGGIEVMFTRDAPISLPVSTCISVLAGADTEC